jgi:transcriptional regulator with XRE-family HTH domain
VSILSIFNRIKALAKEKDITMNSICRAIGKSSSYFADKERLGKDIPEDILVIVADRLGTTVAYLRGETDEKEKPAPPKGDELSDEINRLINELTPENKLKVAAEIVRLYKEQ